MSSSQHRSRDAYYGSIRPSARQAWGDTYSLQSLSQYSSGTTAEAENNSPGGRGYSRSRPVETEYQTMDTDDPDNKNTSMFKKTEELFAGFEGLKTLVEQSKEEVKAVAAQQQKRGSEDQRAEIRQFKSEQDKLNRENSDLRLQLERNEAEHKETLQQFEKTLNDQVGKETGEKKQLSEKLLMMRTANEKYKKDLEKVIQKYKEECDKRNELEETIKHYKADLASKAQECEAFKLRLSQSHDKYIDTQKEMKKVEKELSECKNRLSRLMGNKLADNNPDIADLSDKNRPTRLAERYAELYDNEWTDAYEAFNEYYHKEETSIYNLLAVLNHIKDHCDKSAQDQADKLKTAVMIRTDACTTPYVTKQLKDVRRLTAEVSMPEIYQSYIEKVINLDATKMVQLLSDERVRPFVKGCVELCWLMCVQDPPIVFGPEPKKGDNFDTDAFKHYTKTGASIEFLVWPTLHLHEGGPMLSKGVAQGYGDALRISARSRRRDGTATSIKESVADRPQTAPHAQNIDRDDEAKINQASAGLWHIQHSQNYQQQVVNDKNTPANSRLTRTVRDTTGNYSQMQTPTNMSSSVRNDTGVYRHVPHPGHEAMRTFFSCSNKYGANSQETKNQLGDKYYECLRYYNGLFNNNT